MPADIEVVKLRLELDAEKFNHLRDNEHLLLARDALQAENAQLEAALAEARAETQQLREALEYHRQWVVSSISFRPDLAAATWHAGQMALYRRLEALAKEEGREAGLINDMRFKAEMHEKATRALGGLR